MKDEQILEKWRAGLSKENLAKIYRSEYNQQIRIIRAEVKNRRSGKFITKYEALAYIEKIIYKYLKEKG